MNETLKSIAPKLVELIAKELAEQAKNSTSINNISVKSVKEKTLKLLSDEVDKTLKQVFKL
jgi:hypothetical protein